ncbi:Pirin-related protein [Herbaspirillum sp. CF444]|uniref:pirin family protein n=1 Tax=Herbaspirillum sp. CF444 TaxID=1144319 RepID=UPI00027257BB|nr:pirin family protein [Herbaspirillum sp. CF444]EJL89155.1 Pirin-related protein [Herbaspirillum sp. CF444]
MKKILGIYSGTRQHRIGDGLLARTLFSQRTLGRHVSPFLSLDHVAPTTTSMSTPSAENAVVAPPHAYGNCKMLTIVCQGQVEYTGAAGKTEIIGAGDVQWVTVSDGTAPGRFLSVGTRRGDVVELLQLWIDLPMPLSACPHRAPAEKIIAADAIPALDLPDGSGRIRVIAGNCASRRGAMPTSSSFDVWELQLKSRCTSELKTVEGRTLLLAILNGAVTINGDQAARGGEVVMLDRSGEGVFLEAHANTTALLLSGEPINMPATWSPMAGAAVA